MKNEGKREGEGQTLSPDLIQVLHHLTQDVGVVFVVTQLCGDHTCGGGGNDRGA